MLDTKKLIDLLNRIPHPPEEPLPSGITDEELDAFVERTGLRLPEDLRSWLKLSNGPCVGPGGFFGIRPDRLYLDIEKKLDRIPEWKNKQWIPIAGDGCGNYYVIATGGEFGHGFPVVFIDMIDSPVTPAYLVASDLPHFLEFCFEEELGEDRWPFDSDFVTRKDPKILNFEGVPLPWNAD